MSECMACPNEVRNLYATAHNLLNALRKPETPFCKVAEKTEALRDAVERIEPIVRAHFADHGPPPLGLPKVSA